jgi:hypothetical protein
MKIVTPRLVALWGMISLQKSGVEQGGAVINEVFPSICAVLVKCLLQSEASSAMRMIFATSLIDE